MEIRNEQVGDVHVVTVNGRLDGIYSAAFANQVGELITGENPKILIDFTDIDFVTSNYAANSISVLRNNGNGTFAAAVDVPTGGLVARSVALADLDGDGDLDAVTANYNPNNVSVLLNNGSGVFAAAAGSPIAVGTRPVHVVLADFNGDHRRDIAVWTTGGAGYDGGLCAWRRRHRLEYRQCARHRT